jgi:hypothetical protein
MKNVANFKYTTSKIDLSLSLSIPNFKHCRLFVPYRPLGFQEVEAPRFPDNRHMKVVRLSALRTGRLYPRRYPWYSFLLEAESTHRMAGRIKSIQITPSGIEPATFRLVAQCLNQLRHRVPLFSMYT